MNSLENAWEDIRSVCQNLRVRQVWGWGAIWGAQRGGGSLSGGKEVMEFLPQVFLPLKQSKTLIH